MSAPLPRRSALTLLPGGAVLSAQTTPVDDFLWTPAVL
jgi:hypothetical protein